MKRALVVDDDYMICELLNYQLNKLNFISDISNDGKDALSKIEENKYDLILLDIMLPYFSGLDLLKIIRDKKIETPIIIISAKGDEGTIIEALELGADSFINKPFISNIVLATIKSVIRRVSNSIVNLYEVEKLKIKLNEMEVYYDSQLISLSSSEYHILLTLVKSKGKVFTRNQLINASKGDNYVVSERTIDVQVSSLRKKLKKGGALIKTIWAIGYKLDYNEDDKISNT